MSVNVKNGSGGTDPNSGGVSEENQNTTEKNQDQRPSYESYQKLLDEKKARDKQLAELQQKIDAEIASKKSAEEQKLKEKEDFKKLLEIRETELKDLQSKLVEKDNEVTNIKTSLLDNVKRQAFLDALHGEVPKQYWSLIDLKEIVIDPATNSPDEASINIAVKKFEKMFPLVIQKKGAGMLPSDAAKGGGGKISYKEWLSLPLKEQKDRIKDVDQASM